MPPKESEQSKIAQELLNLLTSNDKTSISFALMQLENFATDITSHRSIIDEKNFELPDLAAKIPDMDWVEVFQSAKTRGTRGMALQGYRFVLKLLKISPTDGNIEYEEWFDLLFWIDTQK